MAKDSGLNRTVLITGGTSGLGRELVKLFLSEGYEVFATGRMLKGDSYAEQRFHFIEADFSDLTQLSHALKNLADNKVKFDMIINNAGILSPPDYTVTKDGLEYTFQVNFLSHLLIDEFAISNLTDKDPLIFASVTSPVYKMAAPDYKIPGKKGYRPFKAYAASKYYLLLIGEFLKNKYPRKELKFICFDPGTFGSGIYRMQRGYFRFLYTIAAPFMKSPAKVASQLFNILESVTEENVKIFKRPGKPGINVPQGSEESDDFLLSCQEAVKVMR
jgi:NAD(P)-dependent dehydrogenase (short-subunit alcohol dehydrogenase family)